MLTAFLDEMTKIADLSGFLRAAEKMSPMRRQLMVEKMINTVNRAAFKSDIRKRRLVRGALYPSGSTSLTTHIANRTKFPQDALLKRKKDAVFRVEDALASKGLI